MWTLTQILLLTTLAISVNKAAAAKNGDEGRPYEFGFTIDGQQHRHEKKDEKGIIQGEFGFITADGIYHTTVYATDENGKFKILSMRSLRISAPLDGSSFKGEISPDANKYRKQAGLALLPEPAPSPNALSIPEETPKPVESTTAKAREVYKFTTQSTIKPACAGCGYVTTPKPKPGEKFQFPNAFVKVKEPAQPIQPQQPVLTQPNSQQPQQNVYQNNQGFQNTQQPFGAHQNVQNNLPQQPNQFVQTGQEQSNQQYQPAGQNGFDQNQYGQTQGPQGTSVQAGFDSVQGHVNPQFVQNRFSDGQASQPGFDGGFNQNSLQGARVQEPQANPLGVPSPDDIRHQVQQEAQNSVSPSGNQGISDQFKSSLPPIEIQNDVINVGGPNPLQIPIKDKFPGMEEGLPEGVSEKDITDLLYKFSYVVGFHGHYEKGLKNGAKIGGYFINGRDGYSRVVTYVADENGYRPKTKLINLGLDSDETPKPETEKTFGLKSFEFVWYPIK